MRWLAGPVLLALLLSACTGTVSPQPPRLLFVTHGNGPYLAALVEDDLAVSPRFSYLAATETVLPGEPVALDVTDRAGSRSQVVLLLETAANTYSVAWFDVAGIEPDSATELLPDLLPLGPLLAPELADPSDLCLTDLQVDHTGTLLALLNVPDTCGGSLAAPSIFVVDTTDDSVRTLAGSVQLLPSGLYVSQGGVSEQSELYWLEGAAGNARLERYPLPGGPVQTAGDFGAGSDSPEPLQLTRSAGAFVAVQPGRVNLLTDTASGLAQESSSATRVISDPYVDGLQALLVLHASSSSRLFVHESLSDSGPTEVKLQANVQHGTVDPGQMWVYFPRSGGLVVVDLLEVLEGTEENSTGDRHNLPELGAPGLITWLEGVLPPSP